MPNPNLCPLKVGDPKVYSLPAASQLCLTAGRPAWSWKIYN